MKVKKYTGETMQDIIFKIKADLGPEAVIVNKRKFKKGGFFGFFGREMFEVVAALEEDGSRDSKAKEDILNNNDSQKIEMDSPNNINLKNDDNDVIEISDNAQKKNSRGKKKNQSKAKNDFKDNLEAKNKNSFKENLQKTASKDPENKNAIKEFIVDIKSQDSEIEKEKKNINSNSKRNLNDKKSAQKPKQNNKDSDNNLSAEEKLMNKFKKQGFVKENKVKYDNNLYNYLLDQGVESRNLNLFFEKLEQEFNQQEEIDFPKKLKKFLKLYFNDSSNINLGQKQKIISFIGPTGVGKTTTMAKLAAHFSVDKNKDVGLITADTYRIAGVEQLKTYSKIIGIPFAVCYNSSNLEEMFLNKFRNCDLILIDTPGSSWKDELQLDRLKPYVNHDFIDEVHLLISLNIKSSDLNNIITKFSQLKPDKTLLTKLDETSTYGDLINIKENYDLPYSYFTTGQEVPEAIEAVSSERIYQYLFGDFYA